MLDLVVDGRNLLILPNEDAIKEARDLYESYRYQDWFPEWTYNQIEHEVLDWYLGNGWTIIEPEAVGALTEGLLLSDGENLWWDTDYMVIDWLERVLNECRGYSGFEWSGTLEESFWEKYYGE
jgi:hypothetical protein